MTTAWNNLIADIHDKYPKLKMPRVMKIASKIKKGDKILAKKINIYYNED